MNNKSNLLLLLLFGLTIGLVGWLGLKLASQQDRQIKASQIDRSEQALLLMQNNINEYIIQQQEHFNQLLNEDLNALQARLNSDPMIHDILLLNLVDQIVFPLQVNPLQQQNSYQWLNNIAIHDESNTNNQPKSGWFIWYQQQTEKYIFWIMNDSQKLFIELNNAMFMGDFIHWLSQQPNIAKPGYLVINDNQGRTFYQWGKELTAKADINIQKHLSSPFTGWSLRYYSNTQSLSTLSKGLFQLIIIGLLILVSIITYILFSIKRREHQEAQQRLSFVNQVSHELKTPLTNIRLHGDLLARTLNSTEIPAKSMQSLNIIQQESERLTRLINNVLNFNSVDNSTLSIHCSPIPFSQLLEESIEPFKPKFEQLDIAVIVNNAINSDVNIDHDIFKQIMANLLSNIEKYAAESRQITLSTKQNADLITVVVQDQGEGIQRKFHEKIFRPFYRIKSDLTHASGSGLGLGLARELARLHGGDLQLIPCETGACFELTLMEDS
ncbi:MAG: HAMP domain-containing sensor histidine kinase [Marinicella sp.]